VPLPRLHGDAQRQRSGAGIAADTDDDFVAAAPVRKRDGERAAQEASEVRIVPRGQLAQALYQGCFHMLREGGHVRGLDGRPRIIGRNAMDGRQTIRLGTPERVHVLDRGADPPCRNATISCLRVRITAAVSASMAPASHVTGASRVRP
jgi:hypothetical protein